MLIVVQVKGILNVRIPMCSVLQIRFNQYLIRNKIVSIEDFILCTLPQCGYTVHIIVQCVFIYDQNYIV